MDDFFRKKKQLFEENFSCTCRTAYNLKINKKKYKKELYFTPYYPFSSTAVLLKSVNFFWFL